MKKRVLIIQQAAHEGPGVFAPLLKESNLAADFCRPYRGEPVPDSVDGYGALIVLGGPMGLDEQERYPFLGKEIALIQQAIAEGVPLLGICLGAQLIARAAGATISKGPEKEVGWYPLRLTDAGRGDPLLAGMEEEFTVFQWHGDTFDIPDGADNLAASPLFPHQAIRVGRHAYGLQFHLEVTEEMVGEWLEVNGKELASLKGVIDGDAIATETSRAIGALNRRGKLFFSRFLDLIKK